jgi:hypothetical protein
VFRRGRRDAFSIPVADWNNESTVPEAVEALVCLQDDEKSSNDKQEEKVGAGQAPQSAETPTPSPWQSAATDKKLMNQQPVLNVQAAVQQMQTYLMDNSYIKVFKSDKYDNETVRSHLLFVGLYSAK